MTLSLRYDLRVGTPSTKLALYEKGFQNFVFRSAGGDVHDGLGGGQAELP
jgi:hypothetical protein